MWHIALRPLKIQFLKDIGDTLTDAWLAFFFGILTTLVGGFIASVVQRHNETVRRKAEARLEVYFHLMELNQHYFWVASADMRGEKPSKEALTACRKVAWKLADKLRTFDSVEYLDEILIVLFSSSIQSANERANRLEQLIDSYGQLVNPSYARAINRISIENMLMLGSGKDARNNAPGAWNIGDEI